MDRRKDRKVSGREKMKVEKKRIGELNKCYSLAELSYRGEHCFLVAAEKQDPCYLFRESGELMEQVWDGPGGVMTMAEVPGTDGIFLATRRFYSPNDGLDAEIVLVEPKKKGGWESFTLCKAPFGHRFIWIVSKWLNINGYPW